MLTPQVVRLQSAVQGGQIRQLEGRSLAVVLSIAGVIDIGTDVIVDRWIQQVRSIAVVRGHRGSLSRGIRENQRALLQTILATGDDVSRIADFTSGGVGHRRARTLAALRQQHGFKIQDISEEFILVRGLVNYHVRGIGESVGAALESMQRIDKAIDLAWGAAVAAFHDSEVERLVRLIALDPLTGLHDYGHFWERLEQEIARCKRHGGSVSLIMIDVDGFKAYNDRFGHLWGDGALQKIAEILRSFSRRSDILARYGGDEFVLILPETTIDGAAAIAERTRNEFVKHRFVVEDGQEFELSISLGCATSVSGALNARQLVAQADSSLYEAKRTGKNRVVLYSDDLIYLGP